MAYGPEVRARYFQLREQGLNQSRAAQEVGISRVTAHKWEKQVPVITQRIRKIQQEKKLPGIQPPIPRDLLSKEAKKGLDDFGFFRERYLGHWSDPWQEEAAYKVLELLNRPEKIYVVINTPPGAGKTTLFTCDIPAWLIARNRTIRILLGSRTNSQAAKLTGRLKRVLERTKPIEGAEDFMANGYGRFKPDERDLWSRTEFIVEQFDTVALDEKEPTAMAAAQETGFLGGRFNLCVWDDLVSRKNTRTIEAREDLVEWYELEAETRLEPGGLFILMGQRVSADDLYRHALNMVAAEDDAADIAVFQAEGERPRKYHHVVYRAHYEDRCKEDHGRDAKPYPDGCLLSPRRLSWAELSRNKANNPKRFAITYQQEDVDPEGQLVQNIWVTGGRDAKGVEYRGCLDHDRGVAEIPHLIGDALSVVTVDPSPTKWWAIEWWLLDTGTDERYLLDLHRERMEAPDLLDRLPGERYVGLADDWQRRSVELGVPITHWIIERSAAQRFMYQYDFWRRWTSTNSVDLIPHDTTVNKVGEQLGVEMLAPHWQYGRVRLPYKGPAKRISDHLIREVTRYPDSATQDCVMAQWFFEYHVEDLVDSFVQAPVLFRPSWIRARVA